MFKKMKASLMATAILKDEKLVNDYMGLYAETKGIDLDEICKNPEQEIATFQNWLVNILMENI